MITDDHRQPSTAIDGHRQPSAAIEGAGAAAPLLRIEDLRVDYRRGRTVFHAVRGVSLAVGAGESVGIVGESGCGKSTIARAVLGLVPVAGGRILFEGRDLSTFTRADWAAYRRRVQIVFQDSLGSLDPRQSIGSALREVLKFHGWGRTAPLLLRKSLTDGTDSTETSGAAASVPSVSSVSDSGAEKLRRRVAELLDLVELPANLAERFPHELSGGQRQRVSIARALAVEPRLVVADEPVSALDVSIQASVIHLLDRLRRELGVSFLFIAHDLAVVRALCPTAHVMHAGIVVESGPTADLFTHPREAYTKTLLDAVPDIRRGLAARQGNANTRQ